MLRTKAILKYLGFVLLFNALFLCISASISFFLHENSFIPLLYGTLVCVALGILPQIFIAKIEDITFQEGIAISVLGWIITCLVGMIPYLVWGGEFTLANSLFESVSGFTTTGATILNDVEILPKGLLFWRASTHFIGGIGIILFVLVILPEKKRLRSSIYHSEVSGLSMLNFRMKTKKIVNIIVIVYISLITVETVLLKFFGMNWFDAVCHSFATVATGGFSTKNASVAHYNSISIEIIIMFFMLISSMHFGLVYNTIRGKKLNIFTSNVVRAYVIVFVIGIFLVAAQLASEKIYGPGESIRYAAFQVISLGTTTGFSIVDTPHWPIFAILIQMYFTIQCGMVGSTSGGLKFDRIYIYIKSMIKQIRLTKHPQGIYAIKIDGTLIDSDMELQTAVFILLYIITFFVTTLLLAAMNIDGMTAFSASIATIGNVGPGFGNVSSLGNYSSLPDAAKYVLSANMLLGRLEIMNIMVFLTMLRPKR